MKKSLLIACSFFLILAVTAQPALVGQKAYGNIENSVFTDMKVTNDRGLIIVGYADTTQGADKSEKGYGGRDYWVIKTDSAGHKVWDRTLGGTDEDLAYSVIPTQDGDYLVAGRSASPVSGTKTQARIGDYDVWLVKLDNSGNIVWDKTIGSAGAEGFDYVDTTLDGNYIVCTSSPYGISGNKTSRGVGSNDYWVFKVDPSGNVLWDKAYGGTSFDNPTCIKHTADGGYIVGGLSASDISGNKSENSRGGNDYWLIKLNAAGNLVWDKTLGTDAQYDELTAVVQTSDNGYVACGYTPGGISGDKTSASKGLNDIWLVKLSPKGVQQWDKTIGGSSDEVYGSMITTEDSGIAISCSSSSNISGDKTENSRGDLDYWLVKLNKNGNIQWDKTVGGNTQDNCYSLVEFKKNFYYVGGWSYSRPSGDRTVAVRGIPDMWITAIRYTRNTSLADINNNQIKTANNFSVFPNPAKDELHIFSAGKNTFILSNREGTVQRQITVTGNGTINIAGFIPGVYYLKNISTLQVQQVIIAR